MSFLKIVFNVQDHEWKSVMFSFLYFFCLMSSYFILRPVRDEMGIQAGIENMQWLFTGTFVTMLAVVPIFGYLIKKVPRKKLIPRIYLFFTFNILVYYIAFQWLDIQIVAVSFFVWLSVFNLFVISIFWSFNSDIFSSEQAKRLFGPIAAGGSLGAIIGPAITTVLARQIGVVNLLLCSIFLLLLSTFFVYQLLKFTSKVEEKAFTKPIRGSIWSGVTLIKRSPKLKLLVGFILLFTSISTFLYFQQGHIVSDYYSDSADRTTYFALRDLLVNISTLILQFFITEKVIRRWGVTFGLCVLPIIATVGFCLLGFSPTIPILLGFQVIYRSLNFSLQRPAREILFTSVSADERYKSKNFIDTVVYRGGDALSGWLFAGLTVVISSLPMISFIALPLALVWLLIGSRIGRLFHSTNQNSNETSTNFIKATSA